MTEPNNVLSVKDAINKLRTSLYLSLEERNAIADLIELLVNETIKAKRMYEEVLALMNRVY